MIGGTGAQFQAVLNLPSTINFWLSTFLKMWIGSTKHSKYQPPNISKSHDTAINFSYAVKSMMASQNSKFVDFTKTSKPRYIENKTLFFLRTKKSIHYTFRANIRQRTVLQRRQPLKLYLSELLQHIDKDLHHLNVQSTIFNLDKMKFLQEKYL